MLDAEITQMERILGGKGPCERYLCLLERAGQITRIDPDRVAERPADEMICRFEIERTSGGEEHEILARTYRGPAHRGLDGAFEWAENFQAAGLLHSIKIVAGTNASVSLEQPIFKYVFVEQRENDQIGRIIEAYKCDLAGARQLVDHESYPQRVLVDTSDPRARPQIDTYVRGTYNRAGNQLVYRDPGSPFP